MSVPTVRPDARCARRRRMASAGLAFVFVMLTVLLVRPPCASAGWPGIYLIKRYEGLSNPLFVTGDGTGLRTYVVERGGKIKVAVAGQSSMSVFLDVSGKVGTGGEQGLLGLAFAPSYASTGRFYVYYVDTTGATHVARFRRSVASSDLADPASEETVLSWPRPTEVHAGGWLQFGPDGYLYASSGDGGPQGDPNGNAQSLATLMGKIIRIDVEGGSPTYTVPPDNPFVSSPGALAEIWAYGLRNPWRCSFDSTGNLFIGDVGLDGWEEIDLAPAGSKGLNFGWNLYEGAHPFPPGSSAAPSLGLTFPIAEYQHPAGDAVVGGYLYEGTKYPALQGTYFFADFVAGKIWGLQPSGASWTSQLLLQNALLFSSFGTDDSKNLYLCSWSTGEVYELGARRPTTCVLTTQSAITRYAARRTIAGALTDERGGVEGVQVKLQTSTNGSSWNDAGSASVTGVGGAFSFTVAPTTRTYYRVRFDDTVVGDVGWSGTSSAPIRLYPQVYLTTPRASTTVRRGAVFAAYSLLKPRHAVGTYPVQLRCYRYESRRWVLRKVVRMRASAVSPPYQAYTRVSARLSLPSRGSWRLVAYHPSDSRTAATASSARLVRVR